MARRYSGYAVIYIRWSDHGYYEGAIVARPYTTGEAYRWRFEGLRLPPIHNDLAVDSSEAYDKAAEAALAFAAAGPTDEAEPDEGWPTENIQDCINAAMAHQPNGEPWVGRAKRDAEPPDEHTY
jgi:hypothetical protein